MGFKDILNKIKERKEIDKDMFKQAEAKLRIQKILEERQMSANERELIRFEKEEREEQIKENLDYYRKKRQMDIDHNHNPLDTENVITKRGWNILQEKSQFTGKSDMFSNKKNIKMNKGYMK